METATHSDTSIQFQNFELDLRTHELYRDGSRLKIRGHPVDVLAILLEHTGELVTRDTLGHNVCGFETRQGSGGCVSEVRPVEWAAGRPHTDISADI